MSKALVYGIKKLSTTAEPVRMSDHGLAMIDLVHMHTHDGNSYHVTHSATIVAASNGYIYIVTPNTDIEQHLQAQVDCSLAGTWTVYINSKINASGTALTIYNNNRRSTNVSTTKIYHTPTISTSGNVFMSVTLGSSGGSQRLGGSSFNRNELILQKNAKYILRFLSAANGNAVTKNIDFYEEEE